MKALNHSSAKNADSTTEIKETLRIVKNTVETTTHATHKLLNDLLNEKKRISRKRKSLFF